MTYKDLEVWKISMDFVVDVYELTEKLPNKEQYGLQSQIRRAAVSIPSNISEGSGRKGTRELINFLYISRGSLMEILTQLEICFRLEYINEKQFMELEETGERIHKMLNALITSLKKKEGARNV